MSGVMYGQQWYVHLIFLNIILRICAYVDYVAYLHRLGF